ncbi:UNVERIFIED_CONTAM: hypothetical protein FKN15_040450 [Acipenser sinensis]
MATGDPTCVDRATGAQAGDRVAAAASRGDGLRDSAATSGSPGGAKQESGRTIVPADAATWDSGPVMGDPYTKAGCLGERVKGFYPQAPDCCPGVVVGAVVKAVSSSLAIRTGGPPLALRTAVPPLLNSICSSLGRQLLLVDGTSSITSRDGSHSSVRGRQPLPLHTPRPRLQLLPQQRLR